MTLIYKSDSMNIYGAAKMLGIRLDIVIPISDFLIIF